MCSRGSGRSRSRNSRHESCWPRCAASRNAATWTWRSARYRSVGGCSLTRTGNLYASGSLRLGAPKRHLSGRTAPATHSARQLLPRFFTTREALLVLAACKPARTWLAPGVWPGCPVEARTQDLHPREAAPDWLGQISVPRPWAGRREECRLRESGGAPQRDGRGPLDSGCCAHLCLASAGRDDRAQAPRSKSATPGGRFLIGRARADLPVELRPLDEDLRRALREASASPLTAPPDGLLAILDYLYTLHAFRPFPMG